MDIYSKIIKTKEENKRNLILTNRNLKKIPEAILELNLDELNLADNNLIEMNNIIKMRNLKRLYLDDNLLKEIPEKISELKDLESLNLNHNHLEYLPETINGLDNLICLYLDDNYITRLPESIGRVSSLKLLHINNNNLIELPESIGSLDNLEYLEISENQLKKIPPSLCELIRQKSMRVYLHDNQFDKINVNKKHYTILNDEYIYTDVSKFDEIIYNSRIKHLSELDTNTLTQVINEYKRIGLTVNVNTAQKMLSYTTGKDYKNRSTINIYQENPEKEDLINTIIDLCPILRQLMPYKEQSMIKNKRNLISKIFKKEKYPIIL